LASVPPYKAIAPLLLRGNVNKNSGSLRTSKRVPAISP
jgi:hypothetical protein